MFETLRSVLARGPREVIVRGFERPAKATSGADHPGQMIWRDIVPVVALAFVLTFWMRHYDDWAPYFTQCRSRRPTLISFPYSEVKVR
jgi:hypothetical protein